MALDKKPYIAKGQCTTKDIYQHIFKTNTWATFDNKGVKPYVLAKVLSTDDDEEFWDVAKTIASIPIVYWGLLFRHFLPRRHKANYVNGESWCLFRFKDWWTVETDQAAIAAQLLLPFDYDAFKLLYLKIKDHFEKYRSACSQACLLFLKFFNKADCRPFVCFAGDLKPPRFRMPNPLEERAVRGKKPFIQEEEIAKRQKMTPEKRLLAFAKDARAIIKRAKGDET